jgi:hypothetical protein
MLFYSLLSPSYSRLSTSFNPFSSLLLTRYHSPFCPGTPQRDPFSIQPALPEYYMIKHRWVRYNPVNDSSVIINAIFRKLKTLEITITSHNTPSLPISSPSPTYTTRTHIHTLPLPPPPPTPRNTTHNTKHNTHSGVRCTLWRTATSSPVWTCSSH